MKNKNAFILLVMSSLFSVSSFANEKYDLKCTLDSGKEMTVSHSKNTVYIGFKKPASDSRDESVIELDILLGEASQILADSGIGQVIYGLRGDNKEMKNAVIIQYIRRGDEANLYFSEIDKAGKDLSKSYCKPKTIMFNESLTQKGIDGVKFID